MSNTDYHLFFGHQNRIKGYIIDTFNQILPEEQKIDGKNRFSNCCILELKIEKKEEQLIELSLSLISTGDYSGNKKNKPKKPSMYWVGPDYISSTSATFTPIPFQNKIISVEPQKLNELFNIFPKTIPLGKVIHCYFVRHGYSTHNIEFKKKFFSFNNSIFNTNTSLQSSNKTSIPNLLKRGGSPPFGENPILPGNTSGSIEGFPSYIPDEISDVSESEIGDTEEERVLSPEEIVIQQKIGTEQSLQAGVKFAQIIGNNKLNSIGVSDLIRTQQTAQYFLTGLLNRKPECLSKITKIYVLPCFHELQNKGKDSDKKIGNTITRVFTFGQTQGLLNRENNTNCRDVADFNKFRFSGKKRNNCGSIDIEGRIIPLDWGFYKSIYFGKYRDQFENELSRTPSPCIKSHFLGLFLNEFYKQTIRGGKKNKTSKNKTSKNKTSKNKTSKNKTRKNKTSKNKTRKNKTSKKKLSKKNKM
jgi:hypothetical protein